MAAAVNATATEAPTRYKDGRRRGLLVINALLLLAVVRVVALGGSWAVSLARLASPVGLWRASASYDQQGGHLAVAGLVALDGPYGADGGVAGRDGHVGRPRCLRTSGRRRRRRFSHRHAHRLRPSGLSGRVVREARSGADLLGWGVEQTAGASASGAAYDPKAGSRSLAASPTNARRAFPQVWTGTDMLVWGGGAGTGAFPLGTGCGYERATNAWREVPPSLGRFIADVERSGAAMLVWGGSIPADHRGTVQIADDGVGRHRSPDVRPVRPR